MRRLSCFVVDGWCDVHPYWKVAVNIAPCGKTVNNSTEDYRYYFLIQEDTSHLYKDYTTSCSLLKFIRIPKGSEWSSVQRCKHSHDFTPLPVDLFLP
jgi:hypothetical protein